MIPGMASHLMPFIIFPPVSYTHLDVYKRQIQGIVQIAHALDKKIVCEGVETKAQVEFLRSVNCHYVQGYYYAKPLPVQQFTEYAWDK